MYLCLTELFEIELSICIKMDLALNNLQWLICHKPKQTTKHTHILREREKERERERERERAGRYKVYIYVCIHEKSTGTRGFLRTINFNWAFTDTNPRIKKGSRPYLNNI